MLAREGTSDDDRSAREGRDEPDELLLRPLVLVADDDPDFRAALVKTLVTLGLRVAEVESGNALIAALGSARNAHAIPDLVITDNHMPGCSGLTALAIMQEAGLETPVILMTGFRDNVTASRAQRYGAVAMLQKPFEVDELRETIARALID